MQKPEASEARASTLRRNRQLARNSRAGNAALILGLAFSTSAAIAQPGGSSSSASPGAAELPLAEGAQPGDGSRDAGAALPDIVVTAQFRNQALQETPLAITAVTGDMLRERNATSVLDVARTTPNVTMEQGSGLQSAPKIFIRGIGQADFNLAFEPGVGAYVDDVYYGTLYGSSFELLDVARIEVLRGPQGTLAGGNSIGGAFKLFSQRPKGDGSGYVEIGAGSYDQLNVRGALDVSLRQDVLALRISGGLRSDSGYVKRIDFACDRPTLAGRLPTLQTKQDSCVLGREGGHDVKSARADLRFTPTADLDVNLSGDYTRQNNEPGPEVLTQVVPLAGNAVYDAQQTALYGVKYDSRFLTGRKYANYATFGSPERGLYFDPDQESEAWGATATIDYKINNNTSLRSITAYRSTNGQFVGDVDQSPLSASTQLYTLSHRQFTQEIRLTGMIGDIVDWTVGGFYYNAHDRNGGTVAVSNTTPALGGSNCLNPPPGTGSLQCGLFFRLNDPVKNRSYAGFATAVFHATEALDITAGYRYTDARKVYTFFRFDPNPLGSIYVLGIDKLGTAPPANTRESDFRLSADYDWSKDFRTYASFATGFKGGGINPRPSTPAQEVPFGPEKLKSYEVGFKSEFLDRRLRINGAAFLSRYTDLQINSTSRDLNGLVANLTSNVGKATIKGLELEVEGRIGGLSINAAGSYLDFKYNDLGAAAGLANGPCITCTNVYTPKWKGSIGVQYRSQLAGLGVLTPRFDVDYVSKTYSTPYNRESTAIPGRTVANARLAWMPDGAPRWEASVSVTNVFNKYYFVTANDLLIATGGASASPAAPRRFLVTVRRSF